MVTGRQVRQRISQTFFSGNLMLEINIRGYENKQIFAAEAQLQYCNIHIHYAVASHYYKKLFCENSDVRGFLWSS